jgi:chemotaxis-related protein WspD
MSEAMNVIVDNHEQIDDCWNRIGIRGDKSCPLLVEHIHCRNCSVYAAAAVRLLDRYALGQQQASTLQYSELRGKAAGRSLLVFRLADEWLALATRSLVEVAPQQPVHSLPHQRSRALLGVANVRGALVPCLSLGELLGVDPTALVGSTARVTPRMLILAAENGSVVVPVDEVDAIHRIELDSLAAAEAPSTGAAARFTQAVLQFKGRSLRVLDDELLMAAVTRSLT